MDTTPKMFSSATHVRRFAVRGVPKDGSADRMLMLFDDAKTAAEHALTVDMKHWEDVYVKPVWLPKQRGNQASKLPPVPWTVKSIEGAVHVVDATGTQVALIVGSKQRRDLVAMEIAERFKE